MSPINILELSRDLDNYSHPSSALDNKLTLRTLDVMAELELWYFLTINCYSSAPEFSGTDFETWKSRVITESNELKSYLDKDGVSVLEAEGTPVGFIVSGSQNLQELSGSIVAIGVVPEHRNKGYAQILVNLHLAREVQRGSKKSKVEVSSGNHAALSFYKKMGYGNDKLIRTLK